MCKQCTYDQISYYRSTSHLNEVEFSTSVHTHACNNKHPLTLALVESIHMHTHSQIHTHTQAWKKRWCIFVVTSNQPFLHYYHSEDEAMHGLPIKRVSLSNCSKVEINLKHSSFRNIFAIHLPERIYYFSAPSQYVQ